jgi:hypothetical protein
MKRDVTYDDWTDEQRMWYLLKHSDLPALTIYKRGRSDGPKGEPCYIEYILTDKQYDDINWSTKNETRIRKPQPQ